MARQGATQGEDFAWIELKPDYGQLLYRDSFRIFLLQVNSESEIGDLLLVDPLSVFREEIGIDLEPDLQVSVLRVNAQMPHKPRRRTELWTFYERQSSSGATSAPTAVGLQYKYPAD
jgi:hypothetical protein